MAKNSSPKKEVAQIHIYEASAGSGKTYALAKRYLQLLFAPSLSFEDVPLEKILAITFTNKATVEMKERIIDLLKKISLDAFSSKEEEEDILSSIGLDKTQARQRAMVITDELIRHYNSFQVQTIDSFVNTLLLGSALNIDRSAHFKIKRDYSPYLAYCLDLVIEEALNDKEVLVYLEEFLQHYLFVENRTGWFPKNDILELMQSLFRLSNRYGQLFEAQPGKSVDVIKKKKDIYAKAETLSGSFCEGLNLTAQKSVRSFLEKNDPIFDIADLPACFASDRVPMNKQKEAPAQLAKGWRKLNLLIKEMIVLDARCAYNPYIKLFRRLFEFFQKLSHKEDTLFLEELNRTARDLFDESGITVAEVYYRLAARFHDYLIDEFQDTSSLQWRNLEMMVEEALSSGGSLFYVGDKKQAIYRFRGGKARLFDEVGRRFSHYSTSVTRLSKNWRSQRAIVEFNNAVFSKKNLTDALGHCGIAGELTSLKDACDEICEVFSDAEQEYRKEKDSGYVRLEHLDEANITERNSALEPKILSLIDELTRRSFRAEDIAILTWDNSEVELVTSWLLEAQVPVASEKTLNVLEHRLTKEIVSFLRFLHSPLDDINFAAFILGDIFTKACGIDPGRVTEFLFSLRRVSSRGSSALYREFRREFPEVWDGYIDEFFKKVGFVSLYELILSIYRRFDVLDRFSDEHAFFMKFLELVKAKEEEQVGIEQFLEYLCTAPPDELYVNVSQSDSVKILTIHKAKGLEFPVVIIPFLRMDINPETAGKGTHSYVIGEDSGTLGLLRITKQHRAYIDEFQMIYEENYKKACIDELNSMYVALTRAQYELYLFIPKKSGIKNNKARSFIKEDTFEFGRKEDYQIKRHRGHPLQYLPPARYGDWVEKLQDEFIGKDEILNRRRIIRGNVLHAALSYIGNVEKKKPEAALDAAIDAAARLFPAEGDFSEYRRIVEELISEESLRRFFSPAGAEVFCEKEIVAASGRTRRIDRLIVSKDTVQIIDYKSTHEVGEAAYSQMKEYMGIFRDFYPGRKVEGYLLFLDEAKVEKIDDQS